MIFVDTRLYLFLKLHFDPHDILFVCKNHTELFIAVIQKNSFQNPLFFFIVQWNMDRDLICQMLQIFDLHDLTHQLLADLAVCLCVLLKQFFQIADHRLLSDFIAFSRIILIFDIRERCNFGVQISGRCFHFQQFRTLQAFYQYAYNIFR